MTTAGPHPTDRTADRADLSARTARATSGQVGLRRHARGWWQDGTPLRALAPHLHPDLSSAGRSDVRGASDAVALLARYSDRSLRESSSPTDDLLAELVFALLEQLRTEALGLADDAPHWPGLARNLQHRFDAWTQEAIASGVLEDEQGLLVFALAHLVRTRLTGLPVADDIADLIETPRWQLAPLVGDYLPQLRRQRQDQAAYAVPAAAIAHRIAAMVATERRRRQGTRAEPEQTTASLAALLLLAGFDGDESGAGPAPLRLARRGAHDGPGYRPFTTAHDRCTVARRLVPESERTSLHDDLVALARESGPNVGRLATRMVAALTSPTTSGFAEDLDEGQLDPRKLPQIIAAPTATSPFRLPDTAPDRRTAVTLLVDCSGSMKGRRDRLAPLLYGWARATSRAGIPGEILGHTTRSWNGGAAERDWRRQGRPAQPGRLADLQLLTFTETGGRPRPDDLAPLLRTVLYRESVTGEALAWALGRLRSIDASRRILVLVTDGAPGEAATARTNGAAYLDEHLDQVLLGARSAGDVEIVGAGVGTDVGAFCDRHLQLALDEPLDHVAHALLRTTVRR